MSLVEKVRTFVRFLKTDDKEYGENILHLLETSPIRESDEYGFMLWQSGLFVYVMLGTKRSSTSLTGGSQGFKANRNFDDVVIVTLL